MDKQTFSKYGGIVCIVLVIAIMIAFATPFGSFVVGSVKNALSGVDNNAGGGVAPVVVRVEPVVQAV